MKYKVGDKVRIRKDLIVGRHYNNRGFVEPMCDFLGKETTIRKVLEEWKCYNLEIDNGRGCWNWTDDMLEPSTECDFKIGDKVIIRNDLIPGKCYTEWGGWYFLSCMAEYMGKVATITGFGAGDDAFNYLRLDIDGGHYSWIINAVSHYTPGSDYDLDKTPIKINNKQQTKQNYENRLQESESNLVRGSECKGRAVCYQKDQIAAAIGHSCYTGKVIRR